MLDMNLWYCVKYIIPPTSGVYLGTGQKAHHFMYTEQYIIHILSAGRLHAWMHALHSESTWELFLRLFMCNAVAVIGVVTCFLFQ